MNRSRCNNKPTHYILLKNGKGKQGIHEFLVKHESFEVSRGEILEEVDHLYLDCRRQMAFFHERLHLILLCPIEMAARLTEVEAKSLKSIPSLEDRYNHFVCQARQSRFREPPPSGSKVFVEINGRDIPGVVQKVNKGLEGVWPHFYSAFGASIEVKIDKEECSVQDWRFVTSGNVGLPFIHTGGISVCVSLKQLRSRQGNADDWEMLKWPFLCPRQALESFLTKLVPESPKGGPFGSYGAWLGHGTNPYFECQASEDLPFCHILPVEDSPEVRDTVRELAIAKNKQEKLESILQTNKNKLRDAESLLALERQAHEETKRLVVSTQNDLKEKERDLISSEERSTEFGGKMTMQQDQYQKLELQKKELEQQLACEQKAKTDAEDRLQNSEQKSEELETTLATAQRSLKNRQESETQFDWMLKREEIHLTEDKLGSGTFGTVYKGAFRGTPVAVKKVETKPKFTEYNEENFRREMQMAARCRHPCMLQSLGEKQAAHEETKALLVSIQNELEEKERDLISSEEISDEFERELTIQHELHEALDLRTKELERQLAWEREARKKAEDRLQKSEQKSKELKTTLATAQNSLKTRLESEKQCDWMLRREEIHLTEEKLGSGSFGTVYKGMFRGTEVAVKSAHTQITIQNKKNFRREIRMAAMCQHPCMLQFIGATSDDQSPLLVTELLDTSLKNVLKTLRPIEVINIALDVAKGLNYLHLNYPNPIVHRDISSGNVLLKKHGESWQGKVSDYGNAVLMNYAKTGSGGAVPYLAPEMGSQKFSTKSDVYSYGVLLLEMCLKELPSFLDDKDELVCLVKNQEMRDLIRSCIHQDSTQRPSMHEIIVDLKNLCSDMVETEFAL